MGELFLFESSFGSLTLSFFLSPFTQIKHGRVAMLAMLHTLITGLGVKVCPSPPSLPLFLPPCLPPSLVVQVPDFPFFESFLPFLTLPKTNK